MNSQQLYELSEQFRITKKRINIINLTNALFRLVSFHALEVPDTKVLVSCGAAVIRPNFASLFHKITSLLDGKFLDLSVQRLRFCRPTIKIEDLYYLAKLNIPKTSVLLTFCYMTYLRNCLRLNDKKFKELEKIDVFVGFLPIYGFEGIIAKKISNWARVYTLQHGLHPTNDYVTDIDRLMINCMNDTHFLVPTKKMQKWYDKYSPTSLSELIVETRKYELDKLLIIGPGPGYENYIKQFLQEFDFDGLDLYFRPHPATKKKSLDTVFEPKMSQYQDDPIKFRGQIVCVETGMYYDLCKSGRASFVYINDKTRDYELYSQEDVFSQEILQSIHLDPFQDFESRIFFAHRLMSNFI